MTTPLDDPLADKSPEDSRQWLWLFAQSEGELQAALYELRELGARIITDPDGRSWRLGRALADPKEYARIREAVLVPSAETLTQLLRGLPDFGRLRPRS